MEITKDLVEKDYNKLKKHIKKYIKNKKYKKACTLIKKASLLMYQINLIYFDDELENQVSFIAEKIINKKAFLPIQKVIVFYDYFSLDNRGLTEQFIDSIISSKQYNLIYISEHQKTEQSKEIYSKLTKAGVRTYELKSKDELAKAQELYLLICDLKPEKVIAHTAPWDVTGIIAFSALKNQIVRYLSNITDHAFWLGKNSFDYFIEWRDYGFNISQQLRQIDKSKLLKLPYYPITNTNVEFEGFPFDSVGKKIIFSGGSLYKIQGSDKFFEIVKYILNNFEDTIFYFLGNGDTTFIKDFIKKNKYENRFFYEKERKDVYQVMKRCYFYLNTYPVSGGLMTQLACYCGKMPLTLNDMEDKDNDIYELLLNKPDFPIVFKSINQIKDSISNYLLSDENVIKNQKVMEKSIITQEDFSVKLMNYLENPVNECNYLKYEIDSNYYSSLCLVRFNTDINSYFQIFIEKKVFLGLIFCKYYFKYLIKKIFKK